MLNFNCLGGPPTPPHHPWQCSIGIVAMKRVRNAVNLARALPQVAIQQFAPPPIESERLFDFSGTVEECIERIGVDTFLEALRKERVVPKLEVPITLPNAPGEPIFSVFLQNNVVTHEIEYDWDSDEKSNAAESNESNEDRLNLPYLARSMRFVGSQYNRKRFDSVIRRRKHDNDAAALYFVSGKLVVTGCSRPEIALDQLRHEQTVLREILPWNLRLQSPQLQNIVASGEFPNAICVNYMAVMHPDICTKVGKFPGTMIKSPELIGDRAVLIFPRGSFCYSGGRSLTENVYKDLCKVYPLFIECQATPELMVIDERCRKRLVKMTSPDQYIRETDTLRRYVNRQLKQQEKKKREEELNLVSVLEEEHNLGSVL